MTSETDAPVTPRRGSGPDSSRSSDDTRQATYRDLFAVREYRYLFAAKTQSDFGDYLARVALTFLVFGRSHSPALAAAAFGVTYFPWVLGPLLAVLADRRPRRSVMIVCDVARALLYAGVAIAGINLAQGTAAVTAGLFARTLAAAHTIGLYGATGAAVTLVAGVTVWRHRDG